MTPTEPEEHYSDITPSRPVTTLTYVCVCASVCVCGGFLILRVCLSLQEQAETMSGMSLLAGKALSSARMSDILSQSSLSGSQQLQQRGGTGLYRTQNTQTHTHTHTVLMLFCVCLACDVEAACYPSSCTSDMLLSYKPPDLQYSVEQAGV